MHTDDSDNALLLRWRAGDAAAGNRLCRRYQPKLQWLFTAKVPPDAVAELQQQTWLAMSQACGRTTTDATRPLVSFRAYLFGIARHLILGYYAGRGRTTGAAFDPEVETLESLALTLSRQLSLQRRVQRIELAVQSLPLALQLLFEGHYVEEISCVELAEIFGLPEGTVRSRLFRARKLVLAALDQPREDLQTAS